MTCMQIAPQNLRIRAIDNMGIPLKPSSNPFDPRAIIRKQLADLTPREFEICFLHFIEARSQPLIAQWLGISLRTVQFHVENVVRKIPQLKPLQVKALLKPKRPRILHLSQLRPTERGPFNADEV